MIKLPKDLKEFVALLNSAGVKYVLIGGHAVGFHGLPRFTGDVDFFVEASPENGAKRERIFVDFGFGDLGLKAADFFEPGTVVQLGRPPNRIDILPSIDGVNFADAWATKIDATFDDVTVHVISKELLLQNKRAPARAQDIADIERLD